MRNNPTWKIEQYRITKGPMATSTEFGPNGVFVIPRGGLNLNVIASDGSDWAECGFSPPAWEHVSVSLNSRCPTWAEMCFIKEIFWGDDELVLQMHVPKADHVNFHPYCLHLWKPIGVEIPRPPGVCVGPAESEDDRSNSRDPG